MGREVEVIRTLKRSVPASLSLASAIESIERMVGAKNPYVKREKLKRLKSEIMGQYLSLKKQREEQLHSGNERLLTSLEESIREARQKLSACDEIMRRANEEKKQRAASSKDLEPYVRELQKAFGHERDPERKRRLAIEMNQELLAQTNVLRSQITAAVASLEGPDLVWLQAAEESLSRLTDRTQAVQLYLNRIKSEKPAPQVQPVPTDLTVYLRIYYFMLIAKEFLEPEVFQEILSMADEHLGLVLPRENKD